MLCLLLPSCKERERERERETLDDEDGKCKTIRMCLLRLRSSFPPASSSMSGRGEEARRHRVAKKRE